jgi:hypothetical protein
MNLPAVANLIKLYEMFVDARYQTFFNKPTIANWELAIYGCIQVSCDNFGYELDGMTSHKEWEKKSNYYIHVIIHKYHRVYVAVHDRGHADPNALNWVNIGNHDTCYRDSLHMEITKYYFQAYEECWGQIPAEHKRPLASANLSVILAGPMFHPLFKFVTIKRKRIPDGDGYLDTIENIEKFDVSMLPK